VLLHVSAVYISQHQVTSRTKRGQTSPNSGLKSVIPTGFCWPCSRCTSTETCSSVTVWTEWC